MDLQYAATLCYFIGSVCYFVGSLFYLLAYKGAAAP